MAFNIQTHRDTVTVVADETQRLLKAFQTWPEASWRRPTYCPDWQAADAVAHLATGGDFYAQVIASGRTGNPQLPWGARDAAGARAGRTAASKKLVDAGPAALLDGFQQGAAKLQDAFESLRDDELSQVAWHPRGLVPIGLWAGMRLNELVVHDWDIRQPHETNASLSDTALLAMLTVLPDMQKQFLEQRITDGLDGVHVLQAGEASWAFIVHGKTVTYQAAAPATWDTCLRADAQRLILLTMGRANVDSSLQEGALVVAGNADQGRQLCATLFRTF